jgi:peptidoglycan/LPS O-acetylase OafA/YrhL
MQPKKLDFIDSLRGVAALYVLIYHLSLATTPAVTAPGWIEPITGSGGCGVMLFFALSAFTLCLSMQSRSADETTPIINYYLRRFFRIAPLFYLWMIISYVRDGMIYHVWHPVEVVAKSFFFVFNFFPGGGNGFVLASWTIGVEMAFYVIFPLFFRIANNLGKAVALFLLTVLIRMVWFPIAVRTLPDLVESQKFYEISVLHHIPNFMVGIVAYHVYRLIDMEAARRQGIGYMLIALSLATFIGWFYGGINLSSFGGPTTVQTTLFAVLLVGASISSPRLLVNTFTRFMGKISYSVYLGHFPIIVLMTGIFARIYRHFHIVEIAYSLSLVSALAVVTPVAYLTYRFIEQPGNKLGRKFIAALATQKTARSAQTN